MVKIEDWVLERAYVPEHLPHYFTSLSGAEFRLAGRYIYYTTPAVAVVVGYPLEGQWDLQEVSALVDLAAGEGKTVAVLGPELPPGNYVEVQHDYYYFLELPPALPKKIRYMVRRAERELSVNITRRLGGENLRLVETFLKRRDLPHIRAVYRRLPQYVASHPEVYVVEAVDRRGALVGFDIFDLSAGRYGFYMFNFVDRHNYVPGTSDLLLYYGIKLAESRGKREINLGLGSAEGVKRFKEKWGARPKLPYKYGVYIHVSSIFWPL